MILQTAGCIRHVFIINFQVRLTWTDAALTQAAVDGATSTVESLVSNGQLQIFAASSER